MSTADDSPTPAQAEADAEQARAGLVSTLNQLRENLKPANVVDEVMSNARVGASAISDQVWETARKNPLPALLIGAGLALMFGLGSRAMKKPSAGSAPDPGLDAGLPPESSRWTGGGWTTGGSLGAQASRWTGTARRQANDLLDTANQHLTDATSRGAKVVNKVIASAKTGDPMSSLTRSRDHVGQSVSRLLEEQPLILAAVGVAIGAAIGAAIPLTERENTLMGETSHSVRDAATDMAQEQYAQLKSAAGHAVEDLKQTAADHGVNADNLSGLVQDVGEKARSAAYEAGRSVVNPVT